MAIIKKSVAESYFQLFVGIRGSHSGDFEESYLVANNAFIFMIEVSSEKEAASFNN
jgi:hypothetical protein